MSTVAFGRSVSHVSVDAYVRGIDQPQSLALTDYAGKWVVLFFYPRDFTFICPTEIEAFARLHSRFVLDDAVVLGASTDSYYSHKAWYETDRRLRDVDYPVIADSAHELAAALGGASRRWRRDARDVHHRPAGHRSPYARQRSRCRSKPRGDLEDAPGAAHGRAVSR